MPKYIPWGGLLAVILGTATIVYQGAEVTQEIAKNRETNVALAEALDGVAIAVTSITGEIRGHDGRIVRLETLLEDTNPGDVKSEVVDFRMEFRAFRERLETAMEEDLRQ